MSWRLGGVMLTCALVLAACGDGDEAVDPEADQRLVDDALLTIDDLPEGFMEEPADDDDDDESSDACLEDVVALTRDEFDDARTARSDPIQFQNETTSIRVRVSAFERADVPGDVMDAFDTDDFVACLRAAFEEDPETAEFELRSLEARAPLTGDEATAYHLALDLTAIEQDIEIESRLAALLVDRFVVSVESTSFADGTDEPLLTAALNTMADRVGSAH